MRNFLGGVLFTVLLVLVGGLAYLRLGFAEVRADLPPSRWEKAPRLALEWELARVEQCKC